MAILLTSKFNTQDAWKFLKGKYSLWHLSNKKRVRNRKDGSYTEEGAVKFAYLCECLEDTSIINNDNFKYILDAYFYFARFDRKDLTPIAKHILEKYKFDTDYVNKIFTDSAMSGDFHVCDLLWSTVPDEVKDKISEDLRPSGVWRSRSEKAIVYLFKKGHINFKKNDWNVRNFKSYLADMSVETLKEIEFEMSDDVIKMFATKSGRKSHNYTINYLFTISKFRDKVVGNPKWMFYETGSFSKFIDSWPREYQQEYIDKLIEELRVKKMEGKPKVKEEKENEESFVERTKFSKEFILSKVPQLRKLKMARNLLFDKNDSDDEIVSAFEMIFRTKSPHKGTLEYETESEFDFEHLVKKQFADKFIKKYSKMPFDLKKIREAVIKEASELVGLRPEDSLYIPTGCYWIQDKDAREIFGANIKNRYLCVSIRSHIIMEVMSYVELNRNISDKGVYKARNLGVDNLIGKFVVTEHMVMSGFIRGSMTLKQIGFMPGEIVDQKYGERHGYDNFWDDKVHKRNYIVMKMENVTGAKELENKSWKKQGLLYAIDITDTLLVFDTMEQAKDIACQLNEENKDALTLDH